MTNKHILYIDLNTLKHHDNNIKYLLKYHFNFVIVGSFSSLEKI